MRRQTKLQCNREIRAWQNAFHGVSDARETQSVTTVAENTFSRAGEDWQQHHSGRARSRVRMEEEEEATRRVFRRGGGSVTKGLHQQESSRSCPERNKI